MLLSANFPKHNIRFYSNEFEHKIKKENNRLTPRVHNIIRCCTSRRKSHCRCCTFERKSRCNETFVIMHKCFKCRSKSRVQCVNYHSRRYPRHPTSCLKVNSRTVSWLTLWICIIKQALANKETGRFYYHYKVRCCILS